MAEPPAPELLRDPVAYARLLEHVHQAVLAGVPAPRSPRSVVSDSWSRSLAAKVDPENTPPPEVISADALARARQDHPLSPVLPLLRQTLVSIADDAEHIMIVTDADGLILWCEGATAVRRSADRVHLTEGSRWSEDTIGTNAMGTALATGAPVQIYSAEHLVRTYHSWTCAAAPLRDPDSGRLIGAIDVSGPLRTVHPAMLALVSASASLAEGQLRAQLAVRDELLRRTNMPHLLALRGESGALLSSGGRVLATENCGDLPSTVDTRRGPGAVALPDGRLGSVEPLDEGYLLRLHRRSGTPVAVSAPPPLRLSFLTDGEPLARLGERDIPITLRHAELLALLALHPRGMSADRLALALYGENGNPVTVRAEIHRLRHQFGTAVVRTRPYRLAADLDADFLDVRAALRRGDTARAMARFDGPLLTDSESPVLRDERETIIALLRRLLLAERGPDAVDALWSFWQTSCGVDDTEVLDRLCADLPADDPRRAVADTHRARLAR